MPSPIGHTLAGLAVHVLSARTRDELGEVRRAAVVVGAALAPDLDLLFRFVDGRNHHNNETHSLGAALLAGVAGTLLLPLLRFARPHALALAASLGWASHVLLDYLNRDTNPPIGLMALWPWSAAYYKFPWPIFLDIGRTLEWATVWNNLAAATWESCLLLPLVWVAFRYRSRRLEKVPE
jgi:inner membrane protein